MKAQIHALLVLAVTTVLLALLLSGNTMPSVVFTILVVLITLIMVLGGASNSLPTVLTALRECFQRLLP